MNDTDLSSAWTALDPTTGQRRRIAGRLFAYLEAHDTSLAAEWLTLFKVSPFATVALAAVSVLAIAAAPLAWLAGALR